jgi:hypothetical protein
MLHRTGWLGGARFAVTDRWGGVSRGPFAELNLAGHVGDDPAAVAENRHRLGAAVGLAGDRLSFMDQVHGRSVAVVGPDPAPGTPRADALVTRATGAALVVLSADCVPVLLSAPSDAGPVLAVAHAGRRGVQAGVVAATVEAMAGHGARPEDASALLGPAVCAGCYEVPAALAEEVAATAPAARATSRAGTPALDLRAAVTAQLRGAGVGDVQVDGSCTAEEPALFSHRRDRVTGRLAGLVWAGP